MYSRSIVDLAILGVYSSREKADAEALVVATDKCLDWEDESSAYELLEEMVWVSEETVQ